MKTTTACTSFMRFILGALIAVFLIAFSSTASATLTVVIQQPTAGAVVTADTLAVAATVAGPGTSFIASVTATVGTTTVPLSYTAGWQGSVPIASVLPGAATLTVSATDMQGDTGSASVSFLHEPSPFVTVTSPLDWSVARPQMHVAASCIGCASLTATLGPSLGDAGACAATSIPRGTTSIDAVLSLQPCDGSTLSLTVTGTDASNRPMTVQVPHLYVDKSATLQEVAAVPGQVVDFDSSRILYARSTGTDSVDFVLRDRTSQADTVMATNQLTGTAEGALGCLTPLGAFVEVLGTTPLEWRNGSLEVLGNQPPMVGVGAQYVGFSALGNWITFVDSINGALGLFDFESDGVGSNSGTVGAGFESGFGNDDAGNIYFASLANTSLDYVANGSGSFLQTVETDAGYVSATSVMFDGVHVAYTAGLASRIYTPGGGETTLATSELDGGPPMAGQDYYVRSGWVAYTAPDSNGVPQVYRMSPSGQVTQATTWAMPSKVDGAATSLGQPERDALNINGETMVTYSGDHRRYLAVAETSVPYDVSTDLGRPFDRNGNWYVVLGGSIAVFNGVAPSDSGVPPSLDAAADAATDAGLTPVDASLPGDAPTGAVPSEDAADSASQTGDSTTVAQDGGQDRAPSADATTRSGGGPASGGGGGCSTVPNQTAPGARLCALVALSGLVARRRRAAMFRRLA
jgi:hypothetical protein